MSAERDTADISAPDMPALGVLELSSIARGVVVADAAMKQAPSLLLMSRPVSSGKHLVMMRGPVAEVEESMRAARDRAGEHLVDSLELPYAHEQIWPVLDTATAGSWRVPAEQVAGSEGTGGDGAAGAGTDDSVAIVETATVCAAIEAADAAAKTAEIVVRDARLAVGIAGKSFFTMTGELYDIEAAADAAKAHAGDRLVQVEIIPAPAPELHGRLIF